MSFFMPEQLFTSALEKVIQQALRLNINSNTALQGLANKTLAIVLAELPFPLVFMVTEQHVSVLSNQDNTDCKITTSLNTLWLLQKNYSLTDLIKTDKLAIDGDLKVAQLYVQLFENIDIDWQTALAKHIGDIPTYKLSQLFSSLKNKAQFAQQQIEADASEWLVHEQRLAVTKPELNTLFQQIQHTQQQIEQLETRILQLSEKAIKQFSIS